MSKILNERAQILLKTLVDRYINEGQPVGSRALLQFSGLDVSTATIRNVMADLEEMGLVSSPHTSAGRIPTALGYRLFIDTLMVVQPLDSARVQQLENQLQPDNPSRLLMQASNLLSELTHFAGVVATPKRDAITVSHVEFLRLSRKRVLLIIVMPNGEVENRVLLTHKDYTQSQLTEAGNFLNQHYANCPFHDIHQRVLSELHELENDLTTLMSAAILAGDAAISQKTEDYVISGERNLLYVNDLSSNMQKLRSLFNVFEQKTELLQLLDVSRQAPGVHIFIGNESGLPGLDDCSVVSAPYTSSGKIIGTLAVVGPKRMNYEKVVPIVDITSRLLSNALSQF
uniref:Heat-inducible transcription repressor HrcA n=1 Tax=Candidatus Nitrotoga fabula TaxID=2182327 RepID=A0A2X0QT21_9PROT|nr:Heat-inducible transcription repressor HrcA [Candidatus Nitrotoga fabula]